jgi:hypothetical protein
MIPTLKRWRARERIRAEDLNRLTEAVLALYQARGGRGVDVSVGEGGIRVALSASLREHGFLVRVTSAPPPGVPVLPSACRYGWRAVGKPQLVSAAAGDLPVYGRSVQGDEAGVYPALVGDLAWVWRNLRPVGPGGGDIIVAELDIWTEKVARLNC